MEETMRTVPAAGSHHTPLSVGMLATVLAGLPLLLVNSGFTMLKEDPPFWRNAGGYPVALRELVLASYYPILGINILLCGVLVALGVYGYQRQARCPWWAVAAGTLMWTLLILNIGLLTANNLENLMDGRALHYHPSAPY